LENQDGLAAVLLTSTALITPSCPGRDITLADPLSVSIIAPLLITPLLS
jgi:hypothetical protein